MTKNYSTALIIGGSLGTGRALAIKLSQANIRTIVVARNSQPLDELKRKFPSIDVKAIDASEPEMAEQLLRQYQPNLLVLVGGARPRMAPLHQLNWQDFSSAWDIDVKIAFHFTKAALNLPLQKNTQILSFSSGASLFGSPLSGGYAGAKRMQHFLVNYGQRESDLAKLQLSFTAILPKQLMQDSIIGKQASMAYAESAGISVEDFMQQWEQPLTPEIAAAQVFELLMAPDDLSGKAFSLTGNGAEQMD